MTDSRAAALGIDVGGTTIKMGLVTGDGQVLDRRRIAYSSIPDFESLATTLAAEGQAMARALKRGIGCVGLAAPGHAQRQDGLLVDGTANVPVLRNRSLAAALRDRIGAAVSTVNDGTAATFGELHHGAGKDLRRFVVVTLGTGVGGGVAIDGQVITGDDGEPPELGAIVLDATARYPRTLEDFACAAGFARAYRQRGGTDPLTAEGIFASAASGNAAAIRAIEDTALRIAQGLGALVNTLNLNACFLAGGMAQAGPALLEPVRDGMRDFTWPYLLSKTSVRLAETGNDAGILGAAEFAFRSAGSRTS
jgi:glucokinase